MDFDDDWQRRALAGERQALKDLAEHALVPLYRFVFYRVGGRADLAEEVVQESMIQAIRDLAAYQPRRAEGRILPWLCGLARNEIRRVLARYRDAVPLERLWQAVDRDLVRSLTRIDENEFSDAVLAREETRQFVNATMAQLPDDYRLVLEAKYVDGRSVRELAASMARTEKAIESLLGRARQAFRDAFCSLTRNLPEVEEAS